MPYSVEAHMAAQGEEAKVETLIEVDGLIEQHDPVETVGLLEARSSIVAGLLWLARALNQVDALIAADIRENASHRHVRKTVAASWPVGDLA